jgi:hypothetical protein
MAAPSWVAYSHLWLEQQTRCVTRKPTAPRVGRIQIHVEGRSIVRAWRNPAAARSSRVSPSASDRPASFLKSAPYRGGVRSDWLNISFAGAGPGLAVLRRHNRSTPPASVGPPNTGDKLRSGARAHPSRAGTGRHLSSPFGCRPELRQLHPLVGRRPPSRLCVVPFIGRSAPCHSGLSRMPAAA